MRMSVVVPKEPYDWTSKYHLGCFRLPPTFHTGGSIKMLLMTPEEYISENVEAPDEIWPGKRDEILQLIGKNASSSSSSGDATKEKKKKADDSHAEEEDTSISMGKLKAAYQEQQQQKDGGEEPKSKKVRRDETFEKMLDLYTRHCETKADSLKDFLRYVFLDIAMVLQYTYEITTREYIANE
jgi:hypothetical protein